MRLFVAALVVLGLAIAATVVPGVFIIDEDNYLVNVLALRQGRVTVANTEGLTPSRELLFFDPGPSGRSVTSTPVASTAPPLYALIGLPFSWAGWRGLIALNTLAFLATTWLVFVYARRYATEAATPWIAAAAFALGGFAIEYAQGVWPHGVSLVLCSAAIIAAGLLIDNGRLSLAAAAGFALALATGVRYQNAIVLVVVAGAVALWAPRRWHALALYVSAAAIPLSLSAAINHARLGSWNPISKGDGYLNLPAVHDATSSLLDPARMFWARVVDFSVRPPLVGPLFPWVRYDAETGAHLMLGETAQKALLQSSPWAILALITFSVAWLSRSGPQTRRRQTQLLSLVTFAVLATFAFSGVRRHEGLAFNQRYLLELLPLAGVGFAWAMDGLGLQIRQLIVGSALGVGSVALIVFAAPTESSKLLALFRFPLALAAALGVCWWLAATRNRARAVLAATAGLCLGWALALHLAEDVRASRRLRYRNLAVTQALDHSVPGHAALVTYWGAKDAVGPLLLDRDIVVLDAHADEGQDAAVLIRELRGRGRRVFVVLDGFPRQVLSRVVAGSQAVAVANAEAGATLIELREPPDKAQGP